MEIYVNERSKDTDKIQEVDAKGLENITALIGELSNEIDGVKERFLECIIYADKKYRRNAFLISDKEEKTKRCEVNLKKYTDNLRKLDSDFNNLKSQFDSIESLVEERPFMNNSEVDAMRRQAEGRKAEMEKGIKAQIKETTELLEKTRKEVSELRAENKFLGNEYPKIYNLSKSIGTNYSTPLSNMARELVSMNESLNVVLENKKAFEKREERKKIAEPPIKLNKPEKPVIEKPLEPVKISRTMEVVVPEVNTAPKVIEINKEAENKKEEEVKKEDIVLRPDVSKYPKIDELNLSLEETNYLINNIDPSDYIKLVDVLEESSIPLSVIKDNLVSFLKVKDVSNLRSVINFLIGVGKTKDEIIDGMSFILKADNSTLQDNILYVVNKEGDISSVSIQELTSPDFKDLEHLVEAGYTPEEIEEKLVNSQMEKSSKRLAA